MAIKKFVYKNIKTGKIVKSVRHITDAPLLRLIGYKDSVTVKRNTMMNSNLIITK